MHRNQELSIKGSDYQVLRYLLVAFRVRIEIRYSVVGRPHEVEQSDVLQLGPATVHFAAEHVKYRRFSHFFHQFLKLYLPFFFFLFYFCARESTRNNLLIQHTLERNLTNLEQSYFFNFNPLHSRPVLLLQFQTQTRALDALGGISYS